MVQVPSQTTEAAQTAADADTAAAKAPLAKRLKLAPGWLDVTPERAGGALVIIGGRLRPPKGGTNLTAEEIGKAIVFVGAEAFRK